jgi:hypothetical protein
MYRIKAPMSDCEYWVPICGHCRALLGKIVNTPHKKNLLLLGEGLMKAQEHVLP